MYALYKQKKKTTILVEYIELHSVEEMSFTSDLSLILFYTNH